MLRALPMSRRQRSESRNALAWGRHRQRRSGWVWFKPLAVTLVILLIAGVIAVTPCQFIVDEPNNWPWPGGFRVDSPDASPADRQAVRIESTPNGANIRVDGARRG